MFKKIPGNDNYILSLNSQIRKINGGACDLPIINNLVTINLYNEEVAVDLDWLALITHFEVNLPQNYKDIDFKEFNPLLIRSCCGMVMVFEEPILINQKYRVIPNYTDYAISEEGVILEIASNKELTEVKMVNDYPSVYIYVADRGFYKNVFIHRLLAYAWLQNDDHFLKPIVNHKDGNKQNFQLSNLEWCSYQENIKHAFQTGLNGTVKKYKVRDLQTAIIKTYNSFKEVCLDIGLHENTRFKDKVSRKRTKLVKDRYEIKELEDESAWIPSVEALAKINKYTITITNPDGYVQVFYTITDVMRKLKIWNISYNLNKILEVAKTKHPDIKIDVVDNFAGGPVHALCMETGTIVEAPSIRELSRNLNIGYSTVHNAVNNPEKYICKGYVFRYKTSDPWEENYKNYANAPKQITAKNVITGEEQCFTSKHDAADMFKVTASHIGYVVRNKSKLGNWELSEIIN